MAMQKSIRICKDEGCDPTQLPLNGLDGSLSLSDLKKFFPKAIGLRYYTENDTIRGVKLTNGKFYPPINGWGNAVYYCTTPLTETEPAQSNVKSEMYDNIENIKILENNDDTQSIEQNSLEGDESSETFSMRRYHHDDRKIPTARRPHRCDICGNCFTQQSHMLRHRRIHTGEKPFACDQCGERFSRSDKLKLHYDRCHLSSVTTSEISRKETSPMKERRETKSRVSNNAFDWSVKTPPSNSSDSPTKTKHLTVRFKKTSKIDLDNGQDGYYSVVNMAEVEMEDDEPVSIIPINVSKFEKEEPASPPLQESLFIDPSNMASDRKYKCDECDKQFAKKNQLQRHMRIHTGERPFRCQICMKSFTRIDALKRHTASMGHQKQKLEQNDSDNVETVTEILIDTYPDILADEMEVDPLNDDNSNNQDDAEDDNDSETHCDVASFAQVTYANLESVNNVKQEPSPEPEEKTRGAQRRGKQGKENFCYHCNHLFTNKFNYNLHMESHRKPERSYKCSYCDYVFGRQSHLTRHILIHTGEKPFQCKQCDERFSRSDKLKLHVERTHTYGYSKNGKQQIRIDHS